MSANRINDTRVYQTLEQTKAKSFGECGHVYITDITSLPKKTKFHTIQVLEDSEISYTDAQTEHQNILVPQFDTIYGDFKSISVISGRVRAYLQC